MCDTAPRTSPKRYCPSHYRSWLVNAHKTLPTAEIFAHLMSRARPIHGASADAVGGSQRGADGEEGAAAPKRLSAATKRKTALTRVISKNNLNRRLNGGK